MKMITKVKRKSRFRQWYQSLSTARPTIDIMEAMRMVQKVNYVILKNRISVPKISSLINYLD
ncbi:hypothetical protein [Piscirickettsia salmonis]|uniref:hypothetical protein n=1 Tax=Piscirickettsia salmonis TaxID=1238 RepID=UPI003B75BC40